jgi:hypothetical protein
MLRRYLSLRMERMDSAIPPSSKTHKNRRKTPVYLYLLLQENIGLFRFVLFFVMGGGPQSPALLGNRPD